MIFISTLDGQIGTIDSEGAFTLIAESETNAFGVSETRFFGLALSPDNELFAVGFDNENFGNNILYQIDIESGSINEVTSSTEGTNGFSFDANGLSFDANGVLYGVGTGLSPIDLDTGRQSGDRIPIESDTGSRFLSSGALVFDPAQEIFYAASTEGDDTLYSVSLSGEVTVIGEIGFDVSGFALDDGNLIGFSENNQIAIDTTTGAGTFQREITGISDDISGATTVFSTESSADEGVDVYRFLRTDTQTQFYTTSDIERDTVLETLPQYELEGISFVGAPAPTQGDPLTGTSPVYRFFNTDTGIHLYTADENERTFVAENLDNYVLEGTPYYAYDTQVEGTVPLYRFYNAELDAHFYTPNTEERDFFIESPDYQLEGGGDGIAFYVEPTPDL